MGCMSNWTLTLVVLGKLVKTVCKMRRVFDKEHRVRNRVRRECCCYTLVLIYSCLSSTLQNVLLLGKSILKYLTNENVDRGPVSGMIEHDFNPFEC